MTRKYKRKEISKANNERNIYTEYIFYLDIMENINEKQNTVVTSFDKDVLYLSKNHQN